MSAKSGRDNSNAITLTEKLLLRAARLQTIQLWLRRGRPRCRAAAC